MRLGAGVGENTVGRIESDGIGVGICVGAEEGKTVKSGEGPGVGGERRHGHERGLMSWGTRAVGSRVGAVVGRGVG